MSKSCAVYMMTSDAPIWPDKAKGDGHGVFKIGISDNPVSRLGSIRTASPYAIWMPFLWWLPSRAVAIQIEQQFHSGNKEHRLSGEWFYDSVVGSACSVDDLICYYGADELGLWGKGLCLFLQSTGLKPDHAHDVVAANYGLEAAA